MDEPLQEGRGEVVEVSDLLVRLIGKLVDGQETLVLIKGEVAGVVVGEVVGAVAIADDVVQQASELAIGEPGAVQRLELIPEVLFQRGAVGDVAAIFVFQALECADEAVFDAILPQHRTRGVRRQVIGEVGRGHWLDAFRPMKGFAYPSGG